MHNNICNIPLLLLTAATLAGCQASHEATWYRGNTHTHTVICGHADSTPEFVAAWYHDRGYHFLILSEHNHFIDPATVKLPEPTRDDFILIPGVEVTGARTIHSTAMNVSGVPPWKFNAPDKSMIIQNHVDETVKLGGELVLNHPNFHYAVTADDMMPVKGLQLFELYNGHPGVHNHGDHEHPSTEAMWDDMLTRGKRIYGVSSDDAHHFQELSPKLSNPGRGWVMVQAEALTPDAVTQAISLGDFYASSGVFLKTCRRGADAYVVEIDTKRTQDELALEPKLRGNKVDAGDAGYRIDFIGPGGKTLQTVHGTSARFPIDASHAYVRVKVSYTSISAENNAIEEYYAWGQPIFTDKRAGH